MMKQFIKQQPMEYFPQYLKSIGIIPGIKVDTGAVPVEKKSVEKITKD